MKPKSFFKKEKRLKKYIDLNNYEIFFGYFLFAGLDFLIDKNGKLFLIEVNSAPGLMYRYNEIYGHCWPLKYLIESIDQYLLDKELILVYSRHFFENKPNVDFKYRKLVELTGGRCRLCLLEPDELSNFSGELFDIGGNKIEKGIIFTSWIFLKKKLECNKNFLFINPYKVSNLTVNKYKTFGILKNTKNFCIPRTYIFKNKLQLKNILNKYKFETGFVIKPWDGYGGQNIYFPDSLEEALEINFENKEWLIQEKIEIKKQGKSYWDIRTFMVDSKYCGALKRVSDNPAVNVSLGGEVEKISKSLENKLKLASEECIKKINKYLK